MRYMLAYMLEGEAKEYHLKLSQWLAERFKLAWAGERIDPHVTIKAPFETDEAGQIDEIAGILDAYAHKETPEPLTVSGFGDFRGKVFYLDANAPKQTYMLLRRLQDKLRNVPWLSFEKSEFPLTLHATLCRPRHPQQTKEIYAYLRKEKLPEFDCLLDHVALLVRRNDRWHTQEIFRL